MRRLKLYFVLVVLLAGCAGQRKVAETPSLTFASPSLLPLTITPMRIFTPTIISSPTTTPRPTVTPMPRVLSPTPTVNVGFFTPLPDSETVQQCLKITDHLPEGAELKGKLVLGSMYHNVDSYILNLENNERNEIPVSTGRAILWYYSAGVSPNGSWLAYIETVEDSEGMRLHVISADLQEQPFIDLEHGWGYIINWLDDQRMLLSPSVSSWEENRIFANGEMAILNPFLQDWEILSPELPIQISPDPMPWNPGQGIPIVIYDPSLTRAVYLSLNGFLLIDGQSQSIIIELRTYDFGTRPRWSPQGDSFAFVIDDATYPMSRSEIYQINREGHSNQITHLFNAFGNNVTVQNFNWSPDGRKIAFAYYVHDTPTDEQVAVVDVETRQTVVYCLPIVGGLSPIWSPDGHQIAFVSATAEERDKDIFRTVIVDIVQGYAVQVAEHWSPLGWMVSP